MNNKIKSLFRKIILTFAVSVILNTPSFTPIPLENDSNLAVSASQTISTVKLNKTNITIEKGKTYTLKATITPSDTTKTILKWTSSNTKVATVKNGKILAKAVGTTTITVKVSNNKTAKCKVVVKIFPSKIRLDKTTVLIETGKSTNLIATISPTNATNQSITWATSNKDIISVKNGKITAKKTGSATVTAKTANGKTAKCKVTVKSKTNTYILNLRTHKYHTDTNCRAVKQMKEENKKVVSWTKEELIDKGYGKCLLCG